MPFKEHVYSVLVASASDRFNEQLLPLLPESTFRPVHFAKSVNEAQRCVSERTYDLVIINTPLPDDFGARFAIDLSAGRNSVVLLLVKNEFYAAVYDKVFDYGIFTLRKPLSAATAVQALDWLKASSERLKRMEKRSVTLQEKMEEIKIVNRAKWVLIDQLKMNESDAHRYIEKQAMDRCVTRREVAEQIIKTYK